jgi:hypothetical protein
MRSAAKYGALMNIFLLAPILDVILARSLAFYRGRLFAKPWVEPQNHEPEICGTGTIDIRSIRRS